MRFSTLLALSLFLLLTHAQHSIAQTYTYKNSAGRIVETTQLPPGMNDLNNSRQTNSGNGNTITDTCRNKWGQNFEMIEYCVKKQHNAKRIISQYPAEIRQFCENKWGNNYEMIEYCARKQYSAKNRLGQ